MLPVALDKFEQVLKNGFNWRGQSDASCHAQIGLGPQALVITGEIRDDNPLVQTRLRPFMEDWWKITYGADGLEMEFDDPTSLTRRLKLLFNFSSAGTQPQIEVLQSPSGLKALPAPGSDLKLYELEPSRKRAGIAGFTFRAVIPLEKLAEPGFFSGPLHIVSRLHDVDGDYTSYLMMQDIMEKP